jgi:hypothetical protein
VIVVGNMMFAILMIAHLALSFGSTHAFSLVASSMMIHGPPALWIGREDSAASSTPARRPTDDGELVSAPAAKIMHRRRSLIAAATTTGFLMLLPTFPALAKDLKDDYRQGTAALAEVPEQDGKPPVEYVKLPSGVIYADMRLGSSGGGTVQEGARVNLQWVLRKSNGYFVDSSAVNDSVPFIFTVGDGTAIAGLDEGVRGMKSTGVRRLLIPPSLAYTTGVEDGQPGPLPVGFGPKQQIRRIQELRKDVPGEYLYLEVQLTRLR